MRAERYPWIYVHHLRPAELAGVLAAWDRLEKVTAHSEVRAKAVRLSRNFWWTYAPARWDERVFQVTRRELEEAARLDLRTMVDPYHRRKPNRGWYYKPAGTR